MGVRDAGAFTTKEDELDLGIIIAKLIDEGRLALGATILKYVSIFRIH